MAKVEVDEACEFVGGGVEEQVVQIFVVSMDNRSGKTNFQEAK